MTRFIGMTLADSLGVVIAQARKEKMAQVDAQVGGTIVEVRKYDRERAELASYLLDFGKAFDVKQRGSA